MRLRPSRSGIVGSQPSSSRARVMSGWRCVGSPIGQRLEHDLRVRLGDLAHELGELEHRVLVGIADVHRLDDVGVEQRDEPAHFVVDVAERAGLRAVAVDRERLAVDRLREEVRDDAPVGRSQPRSVRVEDAHDRRVEVVEPVVRHRQRLGEPLRFVVHRARPGRVDVAVVVLALRVHVRVAVDLARRRDEEPRVVFAREVERAARAERADVHRLERHLEVLGRARRAGEVQHAVDAPRTGISSQTSATTSSKPVSSSSSSTFARRPVLRLSTATTSSPRARRMRQRCEPRNPAPPVMTMRLIAGRRRRMRTRSGASPPGRAGCARRRRSAAASRRGPRAKSSQRNSSHSVSTATTSAPCAASYASAQMSSCGTKPPRLLPGRRVERAHDGAGLDTAAARRRSRASRGGRRFRP